MFSWGSERGVGGLIQLGGSRPPGAAGTWEGGERSLDKE